MKIFDFEYDGISLRNMGYIVCNFGSKGLETISNGSQITFNKVSTFNGSKHKLVSTEYEDCLTATFQICKHPCEANGVEEITIEESRIIMRWLNRKDFHKFRLFNEGYINIYFEASFNVSKIELDGKIYGFELEMITNRPYAIHEPIMNTIKNTQENGTKTIYSKSDEEGYIYPDMEITINSDGDLKIHNGLENRTMYIANCKAGEVIKIKYPMIESSLSSHKIQNDFNWQFFRIANSYRNKANELTISLPCTIKMVYSPIVKVGI